MLLGHQFAELFDDLVRLFGADRLEFYLHNFSAARRLERVKVGLARAERSVAHSRYEPCLWFGCGKRKRGLAELMKRLRETVRSSWPSWPTERPAPAPPYAHR